MNNVNKITLEYLLNPNIYDKINTNREKDDNDLEKYNKYKNKILILTKEMFDNKFINEQIKDEFNNYCKNLVYHIRNNEFKNVIQDEFKNFKPENEKNKLLIDVSNLNLSDLSLNINNFLNKTKKQNDLNSFIIKSSNNKKGKILPKKKNLDHI